MNTSHLEGRNLEPSLAEAVELLATLVGQDLDKDENGHYIIRRGVASDRVISVVDPDSRHGHKTKSRSFDGYKGHISIDPDSELIVACDVTPGNTGDGEAAGPLLDEVIGEAQSSDTGDFAVYGDGSYGTADIVEKLEKANMKVMVKVQEPSNQGGRFTKSDFKIDLTTGTVLCPQGKVAPFSVRNQPENGGMARFGKRCQDCPSRDKCTNSKTGRLIRIHPKEAILHRARNQQKTETWKQAYRAIRPKVERKIAHLMRHRHGGRRARVRGTLRVREDFSLLCATENLKRLAKFLLRREKGIWVVVFQAFRCYLARLALILPRDAQTTQRGGKSRMCKPKKFHSAFNVHGISLRYFTPAT